MTRHVRWLAVLYAGVPIFFAANQSVWAVPTVWTGPDITFSKEGFQNPTTPANQDRMTSNVWITRGGASSGGPFNIKVEGGYDFESHVPADTAWATELIGDNEGKSVTATNFANLDFASWAEAYGGPGPDLIDNIFALPAVVHLISDDIYLNLQFTEFDSSGLMSYERSTAVAAATDTGDFNNDHKVDALDYTVWRNNFGDPTEADLSFHGNGQNGVDEADFGVWKLHYGDVISPGSGGMAVPEPATFAMTLVGLVAPLFFGRCRKG